MSGRILWVRRIKAAGIAAVIVLGMLGGRHATTVAAPKAKDQANEIPIFQYDPTWPKPLPNNWNTGNIGAMVIDAKDHVWVLQRPATTTSLSENYGLTGDGDCCFPAPPVLEIDQAGNLVQSWGPIHDKDGKLIGKQVWGPFPDVEWPLNEHGIFVDDKYVYVDSANAPSQLLKFTRDGKFVRRWGKNEAKSDNDTQNLAGPTQMFVDPKTNELYVADGYRNRRIIVFDAETGAYKRHWGAYGHKPPDTPLGSNPIEGNYDPNKRSQNFATVHCVVQSKDGMIYVCDRVNDRVQVFKTDGTFVKEGLVGQNAHGFGSVHGLGFSPDQRFLYVADGANKKIWILRRDDLKVLGSFSSGGRLGGEIMIAHTLAVDSKGNVYVGETIDNNRVQRFKFMGMHPATSTP
jgi:DNA-binding beta-propeller fold protein YncE